VNLRKNLNNNVAVILAGGGDANLWPISNGNNPKQFNHFIGEGTLIQNTIERLLNHYDISQIYVTTTSGFENYIYEQLPNLNKSNLFVEPFINGSLSSIMLATSIILKRLGKSTVITFYPTDHIIENLGEFFHSVDISVLFAKFNNSFAVIGIEPDYPYQKLGYIQYKELKTNKINIDLKGYLDKNTDLILTNEIDYKNENVLSLDYLESSDNLDNLEILESSDNLESLEILESDDLKFINEVITFAEKPDKESAKRFIDSGDFLWNTGIVSVRADVLFQEYRQYYPYEFQYFEKLLGHVDKKNFDLQISLLYRRLKPLSLENGIFDKNTNLNNNIDHITKLYAIKSDFKWLDVDSWSEVYEESKKDPRGNVFNGNIINIKSKNNLVFSKNLQIALIGIENVVVIENEGSLLICNKNDTNLVNEALLELKRNKIHNLT